MSNLNQKMMNIFIKFDNHPELLNYYFSKKQFIIWPIFRIKIYSKVIEEINHYSTPRASNRKRSYIHLFFHLFKYLMYSYYYRFNKIKKGFKILIFGSSASNTKKNNQYFNRLTKYFSEEFENITAVIERSNQQTYYFPRSFKNIFLLDWFYIKSLLLSKFNFINQNKKKQIALFMDFFKKNFPYQFKDSYYLKKIERDLITYSKMVPKLYKYYNKTLRKINPKVILVEDAHYGDLHSILIKAAKDLNISTAEYQHGLISLNHPSYNLGSQLFSKKYQDYMPDYFLSYGEYWQNVRINSKKISIGNPYLTEFFKDLNKINNKKFKKRILFISSSLFPKKNSKFIIDLYDKIDHSNYEIVFRPHPGERPNINEIYKEIQNLVEIEVSDLYESLSKTDYLISELSTVIFEAIAFNLPIFIIDNELADTHMDTSSFNKITLPDEFLELINNKQFKICQSDVFWETNWQNNYVKFIKQFIE